MKLVKNMEIIWDKSYAENEGNVTIEGKYTSSSDFKRYLQITFQKELRYYLGDTNFDELINNLSDTGFDTSTLETVLASQPGLTSWEWGECFAYDQVEKHLGINIPWPPFWDRRLRRASLPGADIIGLKDEGNNIIFVFGEIKTSSQEKYPPDVMTKPNDGLIDQIKRLASRETIKDHIQWLSLRAEGKDWKEDFNKALKYYVQHDIGYIIIGLLIRDTLPNVHDLKCVLEKLRTFEITTICYGFYLPFKINNCIAMCFNGGGNDAAS